MTLDEIAAVASAHAGTEHDVGIAMLSALERQGVRFNTGGPSHGRPHAHYGRGAAKRRGRDRYRGALGCMRQSHGVPL